MSNVSKANVIRISIWALLLGLLMAGLTLSNTPTMVGATGNTTTTTKPTDKKVCVLHKNKQYIWISKKGFYNGHKQHGDKIVKDKYCKKASDKKVCVLHKNKQYIWISKKGFYNGHKQHGDKIVKDKYCSKDNTTTTTTKPTTTTTKPTTTTTKPTTTTTKPTTTTTKPTTTTTKPTTTTTKPTTTTTKPY